MSKKESQRHPLSKAFQADRTPGKMIKARADIRKTASEFKALPDERIEEKLAADKATAEAKQLDKTLPTSPGLKKERDTEDEIEHDTGEETEEDEQEEPAGYDVADLNNVADVLIILVGKYSRLSKLLYVCVVLLVIGIVLIVKAGFEINHLQVSQGSLQTELAKATQAVDEAKNAVKDTKDAVKDTKDAVEKAAEAAPKAVYDADAGTAKIVIPVTTCKGDPKDCKRSWPDSKKHRDPEKQHLMPAPEEEPAPKPPVRALKIAPLDPEVGLEEDF